MLLYVATFFLSLSAETELLAVVETLSGSFLQLPGPASTVKSTLPFYTPPLLLAVNMNSSGTLVRIAGST